jgi:RNA polymerase sigma-70 factor (ECF subfamily)
VNEPPDSGLVASSLRAASEDLGQPDNTVPHGVLSSSEHLPVVRGRGASPDDSKRETIQTLMEQHGDAIYSLCLRVLRDPVLAEDVLQKVFLEAYRDLEHFEGRAKPSTWLFGIACHRCQDALKARQRLVKRITMDETAVLAFEDPGRGAHTQLEQQQQAAALEACLDTLPAETRMVVLLRFGLGMSYEDIAPVLGTKADTLRTRVERAKKILKRCLIRKGWNDA